MSCCRHCQGLDDLFDNKTARNELADYRKKGPDKTTRILLQAITSEPVEGLSLLDIGGGVGAIQHELFKAGLSCAVHVDASTAYLEASQQETEQQGRAWQAQFLHGNFVDLAPTIPPADIVTLDRVICCYPDMPALVQESASRAKRCYGLVYPRDTWYTKIGMALLNLGSWLIRRPYRFFIHPTPAVEKILHRNGLRQSFYRRTFLWQVVLYKR